MRNNGSIMYSVQYYYLAHNKEVLRFLLRPDYVKNRLHGKQQVWFRIIYKVRSTLLNLFIIAKDNKRRVDGSVWLFMKLTKLKSPLINDKASPMQRAVSYPSKGNAIGM